MCNGPGGGGSIPLGPGLINGPRGPIPLGPIICGISGGKPFLGRNNGGGPFGLINEPGRGGPILCLTGGPLYIGPPIGIGKGGGIPIILGGNPGIGGLAKRGGGGRIPTGGPILGPISGPLFNGLIT